jgi:hypothetical protein
MKCYLTLAFGISSSFGGSGRIKQCLVANRRAGDISNIALNELRHEVRASSCSTRPDKHAACSYLPKHYRTFLVCT